MDDFVAPQPGSREKNSSVHHAVVWIFLATVICGYVFFQRSSVKSEASVQSGNAQMLLISRYILGVHHFGERLSFQLDGKTERGLILQLKAAASTAMDRVRVAIIIAEILGAEPALESLTAIETESPPDSVVEDVQALKRLYEQGSATLPAPTRLRLENRYAWFAKVALSHDASPDNEERQAVISAASRTLWTIFSVFMLVFGAILLAFGGWIVLLIMHFSGSKRIPWKPAYRPVREEGRSDRIVFLEAVILFLAALMATSFLGGFLPSNLSWLVFIFPLSVLFWFPFRGVTWASMKHGLGWRRGQGVIREALAGVVGYIAGIPILIAGFLLTFFLIQFGDGPPEHPIVNQFEDAGPGLLFGLFIMACVAAPILEETVFRGAFYHYLRGRGGVIFSSLATGLIFAGIHPQGIIAIPVLASIGVVFALIREWRGSLIASMAAHACNNTAVLTLLAITVT